MNLLEKLEQEQAAGWPTLPEPDDDRLRLLIAILADTVFTPEQLQRHWTERRRAAV